MLLSIDIQCGILEETLSRKAKDQINFTATYVAKMVSSVISYDPFTRISLSISNKFFSHRTLTQGNSKKKQIGSGEGDYKSLQKIH